MFPYEQLNVYNKAYRVNQQVYRLLKNNKTIPSYAKNQLGRASLSIMLNIAEGSAKHSIRDRMNFFITARASTFECSSIVCFLHDEGEISGEIKLELYNSLDEISRILYAMVKNLKGP